MFGIIPPTPWLNTDCVPPRQHVNNDDISLVIPRLYLHHYCTHYCYNVGRRKPRWVLNRCEARGKRHVRRKVRRSGGRERPLHVLQHGEHGVSMMYTVAAHCTRKHTIYVVTAVTVAEMTLKLKLNRG